MTPLACRFRGHRWVLAAFDRRAYRILLRCDRPGCPGLFRIDKPTTADMVRWLT